MNDAMRMERDKEIVTVKLASVEEVEEYEFQKDRALVQPIWDPFRPFLPKPTSSWNKKLWRLLAANIAKKHKYDEITWTAMEKAFQDRLKRLNITLKEEMRVINASSSSRVRARA